MNNYLILRSQNSPYNDVTKGSVLSFADMDNNLLFLKGNIIYTATTNAGVVTLKKYNGEDITFVGGGSGTFSGGTVTGPTIFTNGLTANTISATTLMLNGVSISSFNNYVTGGTYSNGTLTLNNGNGGISVTGFTNGTPFYLYGQPTTDAGSNKTSTIQRTGAIVVGDYTPTAYTNSFASISKNSINITNTGFTSVSLGSYTNTFGAEAAMRMYRQRGNQLVPLNLLNNDKIGGLEFLTTGYGLSGSTANTSWLGVYANENMGGGDYGSSMGTRMDFWLIPNGTNLAKKALSIIGSGDTQIFGNLTASTVSATTYYNLPPVTFTGGTVINPTQFTGGLTANTISATTYYNLPKDIFVTGGTFSSNIITFTNNSGGTFTVTGITSGSGTFTGGTVTGYTEFQGGVNVNTITATVYNNLPTDVFVYSGNYNTNTGNLALLNTTGGTFNISGFNSGVGTFSGGTVTGATYFTNGLTANTISATTYYGLPTSLTGGSYSNGVISFINSTGGTVPVNIPANYDAGVISGASGWGKVIPNNGQMTLPAIKVALYNNANNIEPITVYSVASGTTGVGAIPALTNNDTNYIVVEYNGGSPRYNVYLDDSTVDDSSTVLYMIVYRLNDFVHTLEFGNQGAGLPNKLNDRIVMTSRFGWESGLALRLSASTGVVTLSSGVAWNGSYRQSLNACNSSGNTFFKNYHVGGAWTAETSPTTVTGRTINNSYYDNGTNIVSATAGKYLTNWYYRGQEVNDHLYEVYSTAQYDSAILAEAASQPALPELITSHAFLVGRIIVGVGATTGTSQSAFGPVFQGSGNYTSTTDHNSLTGLQGGTAGQYYHLTANQFNNLALTSSANTFTQQQTFSGGLSATSMSATSLYINGTVFSGDSFTTGFTYTPTTNTFTIGRNNGLSALTATINTMTGLTVNGNITFTGQSNNPIYSAGSGTFTGAQTEITLDFNSSSIQTVVLTGTTKFNSPLNIKNGAIYTLILKQNSTGGWNVNWFTPTFKWESGTLPAITTTANAVDLITFISDGTTLYGIIAKNFS